MRKQQKPAIDAPTLWGREMVRPQCPRCQMRMMLVVAIQADRRYECLRCGQADDVESKR